MCFVPTQLVRGRTRVSPGMWGISVLYEVSRKLHNYWQQSFHTCCVHIPRGLLQPRPTVQVTRALSGPVVSPSSTEAGAQTWPEPNTGVAVNVPLHPQHLLQSGHRVLPGPRDDAPVHAATGQDFWRNPPEGSPWRLTAYYCSSRT